MKYLFFFLLLAVPFSGICQSDKVVSDKKENYVLLERMPSFPGGDTAMDNFLATQIKYPGSFSKDDYSGTLYIECIIHKDGQLTGFEIIKDIGIGKDCSEAVVEVFKKMPNWNPAIYKNKKVTTPRTIEISFPMK